MKKVINTLKSKNIGAGYLYFYIHFITEIACFYLTNKMLGESIFTWLIPLFYDGMAFIPQALIGYISDKHPKIEFSLIGCFMLIIAIIMYFCTKFNIFITLTILCIGNAFIHINGAEITLKASEGKLSHSAIFVAGGSFRCNYRKTFSKIRMQLLASCIIYINNDTCDFIS